MISVAPYSEETLVRARSIQQSLALPSELDSPFFVARMLRACDDESTVRRLISEILAHRRLLGYSRIEEMAIFQKKFPQVFSRFAVSKLTGSPKSGNVHVFVQKMKGVNLREILTTVPGSDILHAYYALQEIFGRTIVATEKATGSPSAIVTILDLEGLNLTEFLNPLSVNVKLARLIVSVWGEYFSETITKHIVDARTANRLVFLSHVDQLKDYLDPSAIPVEYGGEWEDDSGFSSPPSGCTSHPLPVLPLHALDHHAIWKKHGITKAPPSTSYSIKSKKHVDVAIHAPSDGHFVYSYTTSGDVLFSVVRLDNGKEVAVWPSIRLASMTVPEQGSLPCQEGDFIFRFVSPSHTWLATKVNLSLQFAADI